MDRKLILLVAVLSLASCEGHKRTGGLGALSSTHQPVRRTWQVTFKDEPDSRIAGYVAFLLRNQHGVRVSDTAGPEVAMVELSWVRNRDGNPKYLKMCMFDPSTADTMRVVDLKDSGDVGYSLKLIGKYTAETVSNSIYGYGFRQ